mgnify:CR=1 FL=1
MMIVSCNYLNLHELSLKVFRTSALIDKLLQVNKLERSSSVCVCVCVSFKESFDVIFSDNCSQNSETL